ncbi:GPR endopeptidase Aspartic peptidase. MEROPS family A25 [Seinonella peptonophila]|uniref:Germination protease n=1 Tax=Seinonella peptonophila TaxID=112248 RepID=A0A1M4V8U5_9BACL|nr:GPR endopeptidase [Seinonella peptonophila]SHE65385.1 GPR endopeptidase Aspartic peptidase. MEROPS family A25 [Seinonella peptonophila]
MHNIDLSHISYRTDLAREAHDLALKNRQDGRIPGVRQEETEDEGMQTSWIWIESDQAAQEIGKAPGVYFTLEVPSLRSQDSTLLQRVTKHFAEQFARFLYEVKVAKNASALLVGLGNWNVTADALGPLVIKHALVTRHLFELAPDSVSKGYRSVSAVSPGVLGITGIETSEIVQGVVKESKPDFVIVFDSLASRSLSRVNTTIQVADTGIHPGSGVGNKRKSLTKETLGVPVIAIGIPTVVDAATIALDTIDFVMAHISREMEGKKNHPLDPLNRPTVRQLSEQQVNEQTQSQMLGMVGSLNSAEKRQLIEEVLHPLGQNLVVTPKEVDSFISHMAKLVANGVNCALHEAVTIENVASHIH